MRDSIFRSTVIAVIAACGLAATMTVVARTAPAAAQSGAQNGDRFRTPPKVAGYISGTVTSPNGPEAGVWVIAQTPDLGTRYRKIVVTDDQGRYVIPDLPAGKYKVWVRGYGLVDSDPVNAAPGDTLPLKAVLAPTPRAAAEYYPPDSWYSLLHLPPKSDFPMTLPSAAVGPKAPKPADRVLRTQAQWVDIVKIDCEGGCHMMGDKGTRELPASLRAQFPTTKDALVRALELGQIGDEHFTKLKALRSDRGLDSFADWMDRIAAGELPPTPARPQGVERNAVLTVWDFSVPTGFPHDTTTTNKWKPSTNAYGPIYSPDWAAGALAVLDPSTNENYMLDVPLPNEADRAKLKQFSEHEVAYDSLYWKEETKGAGYRNDPMNSGPSMMDSKGRTWFTIPTRLNIPSYCKEGANNPFAKNYPLEDVKNAGQVRRLIAGVDYYDPKTGKFTSVDTCFGGGHTAFGNDKDETLYVTARGVQGLGWVNTRVWDQTHDMEKSQGWCPAIIDYNGDGKVGAFTKPNEPADPELDRLLPGPTGYIIMVNPVDGSVWYSVLSGVPGFIVRMETGSNPPETCRTEVYEPPFDPKDHAKQDYYAPRGIDFDSKGVVWTALSASGQLASFDRTKCKVKNGPTATGQHCPEGWTIHPVPGPTFKVPTSWWTSPTIAGWTGRIRSVSGRTCRSSAAPGRIRTRCSTRPRTNG